MAEAVVLQAYRRRMAAHAAGGEPCAPIAFMAFGDGGHDPQSQVVLPPSELQEALNHELLRKPLSYIAQEDLLSVTGRGEMAGNELIGAAISEVALVDADGNLLAVKNFAPKIKEADERYEISIKMRF
ncbi:MAG: phage tail protein [Aeromonas sp.]